MGIQEAWTEFSGTQTIAHGTEFIREASAGWTATVNTGNGEGVVFLISYNDPFWLYNCIGALTTQWWYDPVPLAPGAVWETPVTMIPFVGLRSVACADDRFIAALEPSYQDQKLGATLNLLSTAPEAPPGVAGELTVVTWPEQKVSRTQRFDLGEVGSRPAERSFDLGPLAKPRRRSCRYG